MIFSFHQTNQGLPFQDSFANNLILPFSFKGDENGTVALVDTKNPDSALSSTVHARRITGFAFSTHRYGLRYRCSACDYIPLKAILFFRVKHREVLDLVILQRMISSKEQSKLNKVWFWRCVNVRFCSIWNWPIHRRDFSYSTHLTLRSLLAF